MIKRFTNSEIPKTLYKYRDWSNNYHQDLIRKREIFITNPSDFNDPFENIPIRWDLISEEECDNQHYEIFKYIFKDKSEQEIIHFSKNFDSENFEGVSKKIIYSNKIIQNGILKLSENDSEFFKNIKFKLFLNFKEKNIDITNL